MVTRRVLAARTRTAQETSRCHGPGWRLPHLQGKGSAARATAGVGRRRRHTASFTDIIGVLWAVRNRHACAFFSYRLQFRVTDTIQY